MFVGQVTGTIIPQREHARIAGVLAEHWGNAFFKLPALPYTSILNAVLLHDRGYPKLDTLEINAAPEEEWLKIQRKTAEKKNPDPVIDILVKMHIVRLLRRSDTPARNTYAEDLEKRIEKLQKENPYDLNLFIMADSILEYCDSVSYDYCLETGQSRTLQIQSPESSIDLSYSFETPQHIKVQPWPFKIPESETIKEEVRAYEKSGYPDSPIRIKKMFKVSCKQTP